MTMTTREIEAAVIGRLIDDAFSLGYVVSVCDGEEWVVTKSSDKAAILAALFSTDEDILQFWEPVITEDNLTDWAKVGKVWLVYGNDGWDVIADYSANDNMEKLLAKTSELADKLCEENYP